jgi:hypothetical protein
VEECVTTTGYIVLILLEFNPQSWPDLNDGDVISSERALKMVGGQSGIIESCPLQHSGGTHQWW